MGVEKAGVAAHGVNPKVVHPWQPRERAHGTRSNDDFADDVVGLIRHVKLTRAVRGEPVGLIEERVCAHAVCPAAGAHRAAAILQEGRGVTAARKGGHRARAEREHADTAKSAVRDKTV
jgi:hypothetical protein